MTRTHRALSLVIILVAPFLLAGADMATSMSAMRRTVLASSPVAYWPLEDGTGASLASSGLPDGQPLDVEGAVDFSTVTGPDGSGPLPAGFLADTGALATTLPRSATTDAWTIAAVVKINPGAAGVLMAWTTPTGSSSLVRWTMQYQFDLILVEARSSTGTLTTIHSADLADEEWHHVAISAAQNGADVDVVLYLDGVEVSSDTEASVTLSPLSLLRIAGYPPSPWTVDFGLGHVAIYDHVSLDVAGHTDALDGYVGEMAHVRIARLCAEENIPYYSVAGTSVTMGPQPIGTLLTCLREAEEVDQGVLYEKRWGLAYQSRAERENQPVTLTLDFDQRHIAVEPEPTDDDQGTRNRWTVSRASGSEHTYELTTGPMGTGTEGPGRYADGRTVNVETDDQLRYQASYRVHRDTVDVDRWPRIEVSLGGTPDLLPAVPDLPFGARMNILHPPSEVAPDTIDVIREGRTGRVDQVSWREAFNTSPAITHHVFRLADTGGDTHEFLGYLTPTTCVLAEDLDTTETSVDITTDPLWSTDSDDWAAQPRIVVGGEVMTVSAVSGASNPQTLTVTRSVNTVVKEHSADAEVAFYSPGVLGL